MPYIKQKRRSVYEKSIQSIVKNLGMGEREISDQDNSAKGELNYVIYSIVKRYIEEKGLRYFRLNDFVGGVLTCCQLELYRRLASSYEDEAIIKNGDVDVPGNRNKAKSKNRKRVEQHKK